MNFRTPSLAKSCATRPRIEKSGEGPTIKTDQVMMAGWRARAVKTATLRQCRCDAEMNYPKPMLKRGIAASPHSMRGINYTNTNSRY